jgi:hypothetical protein
MNFGALGVYINKEEGQPPPRRGVGLFRRGLHMRRSVHRTMPCVLNSKKILTKLAWVYISIGYSTFQSLSCRNDGFRCSGYALSV